MKVNEFILKLFTHIQIFANLNYFPLLGAGGQYGGEVGWGGGRMAGVGWGGVGWGGSDGGGRMGGGPFNNSP